jgi:hypothetical protein
MRGLYFLILSLGIIGCSHGTTSIRTAPIDANVFIDDKLAGKTPLEVSLKKQNHRLRIEKDGYITINDYISIVKRDSTILALAFFPFYSIFADDFKYTFKSAYEFDLKTKQETKK